MNYNHRRLWEHARLFIRLQSPIQKSQMNHFSTLHQTIIHGVELGRYHTNLTNQCCSRGYMSGDFSRPFLFNIPDPPKNEDHTQIESFPSEWDAGSSFSLEICFVIPFRECTLVIFLRSDLICKPTKKKEFWFHIKQIRLYMLLSSRNHSAIWEWFGWNMALLKNKFCHSDPTFWNWK